MEPFVYIYIYIMEMKGYSTLTIFQELEPHHPMQFSVIPRSLLFGGGLRFSSGDTIIVFQDLMTGCIGLISISLRRVIFVMLWQSPFLKIKQLRYQQVNTALYFTLWPNCSYFLHFDLYIYTALDKNIRPLSKMMKKIWFTIFKLWKSDIWKIRHEDNYI